MSNDKALIQSWNSNADNWTRVVRGGLIASRQAGTDAAILNAIVECAPKRLLDIGCGEGWLVRGAAARTGCTAVGFDGSAALVAAAQTADPANRYVVLDYGGFAAGHGGDLGRDFEVAVFNYALFAEDIVPLLRAAATHLKPGGTLLIQTLHPGGAPEGWQIEDFAAFGGGDWAPMPWYARAVPSWQASICDAGLELRDLRTPRAEDGRILSLLLVAGKSAEIP